MIRKLPKRLLTARLAFNATSRASRCHRASDGRRRGRRARILALQQWQRRCWCCRWCYRRRPNRQRPNHVTGACRRACYSIGNSEFRASRCCSSLKLGLAGVSAAPPGTSSAVPACCVGGGRVPVSLPLLRRRCHEASSGVLLLLLHHSFLHALVSARGIPTHRLERLHQGQHL